MKANSPKRKVFQDALDLLTEDMAVDKAVSENGILQIAIDKITPFHAHPFRLYEGERLADMVQSIREHGVLNPVIVRRTKKGFEMLAGHNRANAAKLAGLKEIPTIVKDKLTEEERDLMNKIHASFMNSEKLKKHIHCLLTRGSMYLSINSNLLYHASVPLNEDGTLKEVLVHGNNVVGVATIIDAFPDGRFFAE